LSDEGAGGVGVLDLFSCHILTLAQLEYVLLAIDDAESAVGQPLANITAVPRMSDVSQKHSSSVFHWNITCEASLQNRSLQQSALAP
jgi:hypothetical protein